MGNRLGEPARGTGSERHRFPYSPTNPLIGSISRSRPNRQVDYLPELRARANNRARVRRPNFRARGGGRHFKFVGACVFFLCVNLYNKNHKTPRRKRLYNRNGVCFMNDGLHPLCLLASRYVFTRSNKYNNQQTEHQKYHRPCIATNGAIGRYGAWHPWRHMCSRSTSLGRVQRRLLRVGHGRRERHRCRVATLDL